jgi:hypothetical protein
MRIACWLSLWATGALALAGCVREPARAALTKFSTVTAHTDSGRTVLTWAGTAGASRSIQVARDSTVSPSAAPLGAAVAGEIPGTVLVVVDSYPSIPGGMSYCQSGVERFLRVLSIAPSQPVETYRIKLASCLGNTELGADSTAWNPDASELRISWLAGPNGGHAPESKRLHIASDGQVRETPN